MAVMTMKMAQWVVINHSKGSSGDGTVGLSVVEVENKDNYN